MSEPRRKKRRAPPPGPVPGVGHELYQRARRWALAASAGLLLGVMLTATGGALLGPLRDLAALLGPWVAVGAMAAAIAAAHNLGRCGPDPGEDFSDDPSADR